VPGIPGILAVSGVLGVSREFEAVISLGMSPSYL
jgi:hypothetical protein